MNFSMHFFCQLLLLQELLLKRNKSSTKSLILSKTFWIRKERMIGTINNRIDSAVKDLRGKSEI